MALLDIQDKEELDFAEFITLYNQTLSDNLAAFTWSDDFKQYQNQISLKTPLIADLTYLHKESLYTPVQAQTAITIFELLPKFLENILEIIEDIEEIIKNKINLSSIYTDVQAVNTWYVSLQRRLSAYQQGISDLEFQTEQLERLLLLQHNHKGEDITSEVIDPERLALNPGRTKILAGNQTWQF